MAELPLDAAGPAGTVIAVYNCILATLYRVLARRRPGFGDEARRFLLELPDPFRRIFAGVALDGRGVLDAPRLLDNLPGLAEEDRLHLLVEALNELVYMECMAARRELGGEESAELIRRVQAVTQRTQSLIGS